MKEYPDGSREKAEAGAEKARRWWAEHQDDFPPLPTQVPHAAYASLQPVPAGDFQLPTLDGDTVRLSDYRGKTVLLNFWTTWCAACVAGGRFNGGELPTTVIVDAEGNVRRRFIGERRLPVFQAMIDEASEPLSTISF